MVVETQRYQEEKSLLSEQAKIKLVPDLLGTNLPCLLLLCQVAEHASLPPVWKLLTDAPKRQQLTTLQCTCDDTTQRLSVRAPIISTQSLLKMDLTLGFCIDHKNELVTGLHRFCLVQHNYAARKVLKACVDQHQVIAVGGSASTLAYTSYLMVPYGVYPPETTAMARSTHICLRVVLDTLLRLYHPVAQGMNAVVLAMIERETELEEYSPRNPRLNPNISALLTQ